MSEKYKKYEGIANANASPNVTAHNILFQRNILKPSSIPKGIRFNTAIKPLINAPIAKIQKNSLGI